MCCNLFLTGCQKEDRKNWESSSGIWDRPWFALQPWSTQAAQTAGKRDTWAGRENECHCISCKENGHQSLWLPEDSGWNTEISGKVLCPSVFFVSTPFLWKIAFFILPSKKFSCLIKFTQEWFLLPAGAQLCFNLYLHSCLLTHLNLYDWTLLLASCTPPLVPLLSIGHPLLCKRYSDPAFNTSYYTGQA